MAESVYDLFKDKAKNARDAADKRSAEVWAKDKRIEEIEREISRTGMKLLSAALSENRDTLYKKIEAELFALNNEKKARLTALGLPEDYTDIKYECDKCSDTGYIGIKMCDCLKKAIYKENYKKSGIGKYLEKQTFDNFDLSLYPFGEARENMSLTLARAKAFAESFSSSTSESLLFVGKTGLGKTHISSAIAKTVIEKGFSVVYDSAQNIISAFERDRFVKEDERESEKYLNADLLIIDDLGAEVQNKSTASYFYTVLNTRLISAKPTIVSTNLSAKELTAQYEERIVSRLFGEYSVFLFTGEDIRKVKRQ